MKTWLIALGIWCTSLTVAAAEFRLSSPDIAPGGTIANKFVYKGFGCSGENVSPSLSWTGAPAGTRSFALLVHDADAPTGGAGWWHWLVYNIPAGATKLAQGAGAADGATLPAGSAQARTDFGSPGWGGAGVAVGDGGSAHPSSPLLPDEQKAGPHAGASALPARRTAEATSPP